jgi:hypothetical protein
MGKPYNMYRNMTNANEFAVRILRGKRLHGICWHKWENNEVELAEIGCQAVTRVSWLKHSDEPSYKETR